MRVLTVRQPWAWAIVHGKKSVENRTRNLAGDFRGPLAIHAGVREDVAAREHPEIQRLARELWWTEPSDLLTGMPQQFGYIIGVVNLWAVHEHDGSVGFLCCPNSPDRYARWAEPGRWHLCMAGARPLVQPLPWKGALGMRELPPEVVAEIEERLA